MTDLKPCPFCGGAAILYRGIKSGYRVQCTNLDCRNTTLRIRYKDDAIRRWNRRTTDELKDLLIDIDSYHELLGTELLEAFYDNYFDPDANFTPLEHRLKLLYEALGFNKDEIRNEAYKLSKERLGDLEDDL